MLEKMFRISEHGSRPGVEIAAGLTTFLTMAYILVVNPSIVAASGMPIGALFTATALAAIVSTLVMAFYANMPFALAPGMGMNAFFTFVVVLAKGYTWQEALTSVLFSGILFLILSIIGFREALVRNFPDGLRSAVGVSIGLMIAGIGLKNAGIIRTSAVFIELGDIKHGAPLVALIGIAVTSVIMALNLKGGMLVGIALTTIIGCFVVGDPATGKMVTDYAPLLEKGVFSLPPSPAPISMAFSFDVSRILTFDFAIIVFTFLFVDVFDSLGTFMGVLNRVGLDVGHYDSRIPKALACDAVGTIFGACVGVSTVTTYAESSAGMAAGGRTGLTSVVVGVLFILALFFSNVFLMVPAAATACALVIVGVYLAASVVMINFEDFTEAVPALLAIMITTMTWSISDGLMFGWAGYLVLKLFTGRIRELNSITIVVGVIFLLKLIFI